MDEIARGEVVWRPLAHRAVNAIEVGILVPAHRSLSHVTRQFLDRLIRRLKQLEEENSKLKRLVADLSLDKAMLQDVLSKKL